MSTRTSQRTFRNLIVIGVAVALMCGAAIAGCKPRSMREAQTVYGLVNPGTLTVACDFASPPMNFYDNSGPLAALSTSFCRRWPIAWDSR